MDYNHWIMRCPAKEPTRRCHCPEESLHNTGRRTGARVSAEVAPHRLGQAIFLTVLLFACWQVTQAELVFHRRDHRDQGRHAQSNHPRTNSVRNYGDAVHYLQKYGYLENCSRTARSKRHLTGFLTDVTERTADCSDEMIADALRRLQQKFDLAPSGRLDTDTRILMSKGRCGNSDISEPPPPTRERRSSNQSPDESGASAAAAAAAAAAAPARSHDKSRVLLGRVLTGNHRARTRRYLIEKYGWKESTADRENSKLRDPRDTEEDEDQEEEEEQEENSNMHLSELATFQDYEPGSGRRRRLQMLQEIADRLLRQSAFLLQQQQHLSGQRNLTDEEVALLLQARQTNRLQRTQRRRRRRRKRTVILRTGDMSEGTSEDKATKFQLHENVPVRWRLLDDGISGKIPLADQRAILELSFRMWSEVIPLKFLETNDAAINKVDVIIAFAKQAHMNCDKPFDGVGGELAHSWKGGDIHFDEDENYKRVDPSGSGINLLKVAVHEVGHVLGLLHNKKDNSIMYPIYINPAMYDEFELSWDDRKAVQNIYGVCKGTFDVVFDWLRKVRSGQEPHHRPRYIFNTYFFRSNRYWMYENRFNRTRFGDPLHISRGWTGIAGPVDAYAQVISSSGHEYNIETYFFVDDSYYKYNDETDQVVEGYPRKIASDFGAKSGSSESIPNDLDAVLFDNRDSLLYFFKGEWVWTYDPKQIGRNACCEGKHRFSEKFPMESVASADDSEGLTGDLDTVFYSYHFHTIFFFKGERVYENAAYNEKTPGVNRLRHLGAWYQIWYDICDVE